MALVGGCSVAETTPEQVHDLLTSTHEFLASAEAATSDPKGVSVERTDLADSSTPDVRNQYCCCFGGQQGGEQVTALDGYHFGA
jgi:hypothetical protein